MVVAAFCGAGVWPLHELSKVMLLHAGRRSVPWCFLVCCRRWSFRLLTKVRHRTADHALDRQCEDTYSYGSV